MSFRESVFMPITVFLAFIRTASTNQQMSHVATSVLDRIACQLFNVGQKPFDAPILRVVHCNQADIGICCFEANLYPTGFSTRAKRCQFRQPFPL